MDDSLRDQLPAALKAQIDGAQWQEVLIGWSGMRVFRIDGGRYLKITTRLEHDLRPEKERLDWLAGRLPVPQVLYFSEDVFEDQRQQSLLISEIPGLPAFDDHFKGRDEARIVTLMAEGLRLIHGVDPAGCPFDQRIDVMLRAAHDHLVQHRIDEARFDPSRRGRDAAELYAELLETRPASEDLVFVHGDYCLPNILIDPDRLTLNGFIDWGSAGVADRTLDLALAARSIAFNLGAQWVPPFFEAYGGGEVDAGKVEFFQILDEFF